MADLPDTKGMSLVEMLDLLRPIPEPDPISMMPATQGWLWLALAVLAALLWALVAFLRHRRANAYRREALRQLEGMDGDPARMASVLRRTALVAYPRREVATLVGEDWLHFLNASCPGVPFAGDAGQALIEGPYRGAERNADLDRQCRHWIKKHRKEGKA